ncbi:MAG: hypothetical protein KGQ70_08955 [Alphaproteobacteria bacterium]|nr:hypothetical protein [Alphaproteobacteria bacterium]
MTSKKPTLRALLWSMTLLPTAACATHSRADFCQIYRPVYMSRKDTEKTKRQIDGNNAAWVALCKK